ncbi:MAG: Asp-tRNA(Asn)/Glu-tRNA(Gln) amidotransferase subunit GatA [Candidatus Delongbacteria bacterium]|nr:Asp-tRNA(Asn)/Glu-tRNA(Gln) amidotransferase subunit GatA [Candidatus Delongbacteria bacterium]
MRIVDRSIAQLIEALDQGKLTRKQIMQAYWDQIDACNSGINAYLSLNREPSIRKAEEWDQAADTMGRDKIPFCSGMPIAIKDNICTRGIRTTCASRILEEFIPPYSATVVERLEEQGLICLGKTNMDEFAMGSSNENSAFGVVGNPHDPERIPGGSSGGSAAAVAAGMAPWALGSDTGGSIRQPAALCGVVGMKPTYGRVSRYGLIAFASSFDQIGPITRRVYDNALLLKIIAGYDPHDSTSADQPVPDYPALLTNLPRPIRIGIPEGYIHQSLQPEIRETISRLQNQLQSHGIEFIPISLPHTQYGIATYYILTTAEASSNLARYDGIKYGRRSAAADDLKSLYINSRTEGFGDEVKRRIMLGTYVLSSGYYEAYYGKASKVRTLIRQDFVRAFEQCDIIMTPTTPTTAFKKGEKTDNPLQMYLSDIYTISVNLAGVPAISLPVGRDSHHLPIGIQLIGNFFEEATIYQAAYLIEQLAQEKPI